MNINEYSEHEEKEQHNRSDEQTPSRHSHRSTNTDQSPPQSHHSQSAQEEELESRTVSPFFFPPRSNYYDPTLIEKRIIFENKYNHRLPKDIVNYIWSFIKGDYEDHIQQEIDHEHNLKKEIAFDYLTELDYIPYLEDTADLIAEIFSEDCWHTHYSADFVIYSVRFEGEDIVYDYKIELSHFVWELLGLREPSPSP